MKAAKIFMAFALIVALGACSSTPRTADAQRSDYVSNTEKKLDNWENKISKLRADRQAAPRAALMDARAELMSLKTAPESNWATYRGRVDTRVSYVERSLQNAQAE